MQILFCEDHNSNVFAAQEHEIANYLNSFDIVIVECTRDDITESTTRKTSVVHCRQNPETIKKFETAGYFPVFDEKWSVEGSLIFWPGEIGAFYRKIIALFPQASIRALISSNSYAEMKQSAWMHDVAVGKASR